MRQSENSENAAFTAAGKQSDKKTDKKPKKPDTCYFCRKPGHWIQDCRKRKAASPKQISDKGEALVGEALSGTTQSNKTINDEWYMNSGATDHISNQRAWFATYNEFQKKISVRIGDGKFIPAVGSEEINILTFDGKE